MRRVIAVLAFAVSFFVPFVSYGFEYPVETITEYPVENVIEYPVETVFVQLPYSAPIFLSVPLNPLKEQILNKLISCESGGKIDAINHADTAINGYPSKGILQFSPKTFLLKGKVYGHLPSHYTLSDISSVIWDSELQKKIAWDMLTKEPKGHRHWLNCSLKMGIPGLLAGI